jgi:hypothetical protein
MIAIQAVSPNDKRHIGTEYALHTIPFVVPYVITTPLLVMPTEDDNAKVSNNLCQAIMSHSGFTAHHWTLFREPKVPEESKEPNGSTKRKLIHCNDSPESSKKLKTSDSTGEEDKNSERERERAELSTYDTSYDPEMTVRREDVKVLSL